MRRKLAAGVGLVLLAQLLAAPPAAAQPSTSDPASPGATNSAPRSDVAPADRGRILGGRWRSSTDLAWTTSGDATGFHLLVARASDGYAWRTAATLAESGFDTDMWIGNACVTASGRRAVVVYAPRSFTNRADLFDRGGFTAVVDLMTGAVTKLARLSTLAYFNPGCGAGETAVLTQLSGDPDDTGETPARTRLTVVDAATATMRTPVDVPGELTSAVPAANGIAAAAAGQLVSITAAGKVSTIAAASGVPFHLTADSGGGIAYAERGQQESMRVRRAVPGSGRAPATLATGRLGEVGLAGAGGKTYLTGSPRQVNGLPPSIRRANTAAGAGVSTQGQLAVTQTIWAGKADPRLAPADPDMPRTVRIGATSLVTGQTVTFGVGPARPATQPATISPKLAGPGTSRRTVAATTSDPVDQDRWCSVPRNNRIFQVLQPKPRQVEWAIDQAVTSSLTVQRPTNWMNLGMPAYTPQGMFPSIDLLGGGRVHAQIMLGIAAQESNMWQASRLAVPGVTGNPLIGNFYGLDIYDDDIYDDWDIRWEEADCGYGVMQVTDGMRLAGHEKPGETALAWTKQQAIAADFAANVAAGLQILQSKWNQTRAAGLVVGNGDPAGLENWFFAVWAYNSGFHPNLGDGSPWGLGWANNPVNPRYPADRYPFMETSYEDSAHPQDWPYPEKVIGFAGHPPDLPESAERDSMTFVSGFRPAWWTNVAHRLSAKPVVDQFCAAVNDCYPGQLFLPNDPGEPDDPDDGTIGEPAGPCAHKNARGYYDLMCWWHLPTQWKSDPATTGRELLRFDPGYEYQDNATSFPPKCHREDLPAGSLIVDDEPASTPKMRTCGNLFNDAGTFTLSIPQDTTGHYRAKVDLHQLGGGFNAHFWFAHTHRADDMGGSMKITGTWNFNQVLNGWGRVMVHIPDHGAHTQQAKYEIDTGGGFTSDRYRVILQRIRSNTWVPLGAFKFTGLPKVRLSTTTQDGIGDEDIAWDAVAIQPLSVKPTNQIVALGDSYASGEGAGDDDVPAYPYYPETDFKLVDNGTDAYQNACHRSKNSWSRLAQMPDSTATVGLRTDQWDGTMDYHLLACSGARTENLLPYYSVPAAQRPTNEFGLYGHGQYSELSQLDRGFLDENTTLVTLSIGGNDARFSDIVKQCIYGSLPELGDSCFTATLEGDSNILYYVSPERIRGPVKESIHTVLTEIHKKAPNAQILLMAYPKLFSDQDDHWCVDGISDIEEGWLGEQAALIQTEFTNLGQQMQTEGVPVRVGQPIDYFLGRGICASTPAINGVIVDQTRGESDDLTSQQSFHPNLLGELTFAGVMTLAVDDM
ncbi:SGNH/GDSL hydrolase family protein [Hamadaea sp. NPDC051192]|uniref:SGNH/GDSL hydrolase family protein n=1 Tax=Hamadaea sp. NPDC051192 TaxID=3154940 RepID=UPI003434D31C